MISNYRNVSVRCWVRVVKKTVPLTLCIGQQLRELTMRFQSGQPWFSFGRGLHQENSILGSRFDGEGQVTKMPTCSRKCINTKLKANSDPVRAEAEVEEACHPV